MYIIFDTETTGLPLDYNAPIHQLDNWPRVVQIAWQLHAPNGQLIASNNKIIRPTGFSIPFNAVKVHGITTEKAHQLGEPLEEVMSLFLEDAAKAKFLVGHNIEFDINIIACELLRIGHAFDLLTIARIDTKEKGTATQ